MDFKVCEECINERINADAIMDGMLCAGFCGANTRGVCQVTTLSSLNPGTYVILTKTLAT